MFDLLLLAAHKSALETAPSGPTGPSMSLCVAIVGFLTALGVVVTLLPAKRTSEIKRPHEE